MKSGMKMKNKEQMNSEGGSSSINILLFKCSAFEFEGPILQPLSGR